MNEHAYEPSFNAPPTNGGVQTNEMRPEYSEPPAPPRMRIVAGEGGLGVMFGALAKAQANFKPIKANASVEIQPNQGKSYKFSYAPLEVVLAACVPALNAEGFFFSQPLYSAADGEGYVLRTCLMHASGGLLEVETYIPKPAGRIQDLGSAVTYQRRYVAQALFGVNSEDDDDGSAASGDTRTKVPPKAPQPSAQPPQQRPAAQNGAPASAAPKAASATTASASTASPPTSAAGAKSESTPETTTSTTGAATTATSDPAPANETRVERHYTEDQDRELTDLFGQLKKLGAKFGPPAVNAYIQRLTGKQGADMLEGDANVVIADLKQRVATKNLDFSPPRAS